MCGEAGRDEAAQAEGVGVEVSISAHIHKLVADHDIHVQVSRVRFHHAQQADYGVLHRVSRCSLSRLLWLTKLHLQVHVYGSRQEEPRS